MSRFYTKNSVPERIFNVVHTLNNFDFMPQYLLTLFLCLKFTLDVLCRDMTSLSQSVYLFDFINQGRSYLYFHKTKLYIQNDKDLLLSTVWLPVSCFLLLVSIVFLNINTEKKKSFMKIIAKGILLINYMFSSLIFSFGLEILMRSSEKMYLIPLSLVLLSVNIIASIFLQIWMCTWTFKKNSILNRSRSKFEIIKFLILRIIQIYFTVRSGNETYNQFAVTALVLVLCDTFGIRNIFKQMVYYHETSQKIYRSFLIIELILNLLIIVNVLQIQLLNQNIIYGWIFGSYFMIWATQSYWRNFKFQIVTKQTKDIQNENEAIIHMRCIDELLSKVNDSQNALIVTGIIISHTMDCKNVECVCKQLQNSSRVYSKSNQHLIKAFFSSTFNQLYNQFPNSPYVLITWLNFSLDVCSQYTHFLPELQLFFLSKKKLFWTEKLLYLQGANSFQCFIQQGNQKQKSIDTETTFRIMETVEEIKQQMMKSAHNFSQRWRIICNSYCQLVTIENIFNAILQNMKNMNSYWEFIKQNKIKSIQVYTIFYLYYLLILNQPSEYKAITDLINILSEYLKGIKYVDVSNIRQLIFNDNACNVQTPIRADTIGIIGNCTNNCQNVLKISKKQLIGKNIKFLMPSTLAKCHDTLLDNWIKTGTKRSINKIKRVYGLRGDLQKQLFGCDLYLKLFSNTITHNLSFVVSIVLRNSTDYVIINPDMIVEGYGSKFKAILPKNIIGQSFVPYNSSVYQLWLGANDNEVSRISIIKKHQENKNVIKLYKLKMLVTQYLMAGKKFLLIKILSISKPTHVEKDQSSPLPASTTILVQQSNFEFSKDQNLEPQNQSINFSQTIDPQDQKLVTVKDMNKNCNNDSSSVTSSVGSVSYSFTKIRAFCLQKFYNANYIKINVLKTITILISVGLIMCIVLQWLQIKNCSNKFLLYKDIVQKAAGENNIFLMKAVMFNQVIDIKQKYGLISQNKFDKIIQNTRLVNLRINNILSKDFERLNQQKQLPDPTIKSSIEIQTNYKFINNSVNIQFLHFAKLQQAKIQQLLYGQINKDTIAECFDQLNRNWGSIIQLILTGSKKSFEQLFSILSVDKLTVYAYSIVIVIFFILIMIIINWHYYGVKSRKNKILFINEAIPYKYSELRRQYYLRIKQILKAGKIQQLVNLNQNQDEQNLRSASIISIDQKQNNLLYFICMSLLFILILSPLIAIVGQTTKIFIKQQQIGYMMRQLLQMQQIVFATYTSAHHQALVKNEWTPQYDELMKKFTNANKSLNSKFQSLYIRYATLLNEKKQKISVLVNMDLCQLLKQELNNKQMQLCKEKNQTLKSKGIFLSMQQLIVYTQEIIIKVVSQQQPLDSQFDLKLQGSIYFIFLGYQILNTVAIQDLSSFLRDQYQITGSLLILHIVFCAIALILWIGKSIRQVRTYSSLYGYAMLYPLKLIKNNKLAFRVLEQNIFKSF